jgi:hypothetical protein
MWRRDKSLAPAGNELAGRRKLNNWIVHNFFFTKCSYTEQTMKDGKEVIWREGQNTEMNLTQEYNCKHSRKWELGR